LTTQFCRADQYSPLVTILVVDTNPTLVRALSLQLRECGYRALGATSFHEAQRMWDAEQPQVLVADVRLAAYNGLHLLIRARAVRPEVTAIITSPVPDRVLADETQRLGGTFLVKPVDVGDIVTAIEDQFPAVAPASRVSLASLIYREFHDDAGAPAIARRPMRSEQEVAASSAPVDSTLVRAVSHDRR
jgi:DNA-binding NtrC family response regulator